MASRAQQKKKISEDKQKSFMALVHLCGRAAYITVGWFILGMGISTSFFVSMFLFVFPMLLDCLQFLLAGWSRKTIIISEIAFCWICLVFASLGIASVFIIVPDGGVFYITTSSNFVGFSLSPISVTYIWKLLGFIVIMPVIDYACRNE